MTQRNENPSTYEKYTAKREISSIRYHYRSVQERGCSLDRFPRPS